MIYFFGVPVTQFDLYAQLQRGDITIGQYIDQVARVYGYCKPNPATVQDLREAYEEIRGNLL